MKNTFFQVIKTSVYTLSACSILALTSCQGSSNEPQAMQAHANQFVSVPIQAEVALDESARALVYTLGEGGSFQHNLRENKQRMWTIIRSSDASKPSYSAELEWEVQAGNRLVLNTQVSLPTNVHTAIEQGNWYASCILSGQASASGQSFVYDPSKQRLVATTPNGTNRLDYNGTIAPGTETSQMPSLYIMPWTKVSTTINEAGKKVLAFSGNRLKPMGTVVRLNIQTEPATYQMANNTPEVEAVRDYLNESSWQPEVLTVKGRYNGYYDFSGATLNHGALPRFIYTDSNREYVCTIPSPSAELKFGSPSQEYGYIYLWSPDNQIEVSAKLKYAYSSSNSQGVSSGVKTPSTFDRKGNLRTYQAYPDMPRIWKLVPNESGHANGGAAYEGVLAGFGPILKDYGDNSTFRFFSTDSEIIIVPPYPDRAYTLENSIRWDTAFKAGVQGFGIQEFYPSTRVLLKNGYSKRVLLKYRPEVKHIEKQQILWAPYVGA